MTEQTILDLIGNFEKETWKYNSNDKLDNDMQYIYSIEKELKTADKSNLQPIYDKLISMMGIIRFKYGFESMVINTNPELENLKVIINDISLNSGDIINQFNYISTVYNNFSQRARNLDFIINNYENLQGKEGLYLAVESLKSLITNQEYRKLLNNNQVNEIIVDCLKLNNGVTDIRIIEQKYKDIIKQIWEQSISSKVDENGDFRFLFSNISGGDLRNHADLLVNRPNQSSCSMISSNFIATYGSSSRKIGFIYPNNSEVIMSSAYDLGSNVFGDGVVNKEKGTQLATPEVIEKIGISRAKSQNEDLFSSSCYNEILVNAKPCGIVVLGTGEKELSSDYQEAKMLSLEMNLPIYYIDTMLYKNRSVNNSNSVEQKNNDIYVSLEQLSPILSEQGYMCLGHGTGRTGNSEEVVDSIFSNGLRAKDNSLYFTTIGLSTPTPEIIQQYAELGIPAPTLEDLKNQMNNWQHQDSKKIIIARIPTEYINMMGDRSDLDGEMYGAFMTEKEDLSGNKTSYLDPKFIIGCFDVEKQQVKLNKSFESTLSPETIERLKEGYKRALEKTKERIQKSGTIMAVPSTQTMSVSESTPNINYSYDSFDFDEEIEWEQGEVVGKSR